MFRVCFLSHEIKDTMLQALPLNSLFAHSTPAVASEALCIYDVGIDYI